MKIIKTTVGLILAASFIFATGCSQKNNSSNGKDNANAKTITMGNQEGNKYTNDYFGLELDVPEGWTIASDEESGETDKRYVASVISSIIMLIFGLFAWALVPLMFELPEALMAMLAGFVLLGVFASTMRTSFGNSKYTMAVIFTYIISVSGISIFYISAPVWALLIGTILAKVVRK